MFVATAGPASAIVHGGPDNGEHPYVGIYVAYYSNGDGDLVAGWRCTGTQMDDNTFLTAGHCAYGAEAAAIWYGDDLRDVAAAGEFRLFTDAIDQDSPLDADAWSTTVIAHPDYDDADDTFALNDAGIVDDMTLADDRTFDEFGALPEAGYWDGQLSTRKKDRDSFTPVGYGLQRGTPPSNGQGRADEAEWLKLKAGGELIGDRQFSGQFAGGKDNHAYVVLTNNARTGGTCSGDSGGPYFIKGTNVVAALTSFGMTYTCGGTGGAYRLDTPDTLEWLSKFIN